MAKLTGAKKAAFLKRMAAGRRKAARGNPRKKATRKAPRKKATAKRPAPRKKKAKAKRSTRNSSLRKSKKVIGKGFSRPVAAQWAKEKRAAKKKRAPKKRNGSRRRKNSDDLSSAERMYEAFHGKAPGHVEEYELPYLYPQNFAELGELKELRVRLDAANPRFPLTRFGDCLVVCTGDGNNIYFVGGDQAIDLAALDITSDKDDVDLGPCVYICYHTRKGFHDFAPINYFHEFGEEDGICPRLTYNRLNKRLYLVSGNYRVKPEGIVN